MQSLPDSPRTNPAPVQAPVPIATAEMPTLMSLAGELKFQIVSHTDLDCIVALALSSKGIHMYCGKRLKEQKERKRAWSTITVGEIDSLMWRKNPPVSGVHPLPVLRDLLADTGAWVYTKTLTIGYLEGTTGQGFRGEDKAELDMAELQDAVAEMRFHERLLRKVLEVQQYLYPGRGETDILHCPQATQWTRKILCGDMGAAASLLVAVLPNVQKIRLVNYYRIIDSQHLLTLEHLLRAAISERDKPIGINSFDNLTEIGMHGIFGHCVTSYDLLNGFMELPSMRTIKGRMIVGDGGDPRPFSNGAIEPSKVTSLEFDCSAIDAASFSSSLRGIEGLQKFVFNFWAGAFSSGRLWEPRQIMRVLGIHTTKTLRHLELTYDWDTEGAEIEIDKGEPFIGSLCAFEALETIRLETLVLYREVQAAKPSTGAIWIPTHPRRLVDALPLSACRLQLVGPLPKHDATAMLADVASRKDEMLPNLTSIYFEHLERAELDETVVTECEGAGVEMGFGWNSS